VIIFCAAIATAGCNQAATESTILTKSRSSEDVALTVSVDTPFDTPGLVITVVAKNMSQDTFRYTATCGRADMEFAFLDAEGHELRVTNPCEPKPMMDCPTAMGAILRPDGTATAREWWSGTLWNDCTGTEAPAGDYRIRVTFTFYQDIEVGREDVEATGTFHWSP